MELLKEVFVGYVLTVITLGLYAPWFICRMHHWSTENSILFDANKNVVKFKFRGTGGELFATLILGGLLTVVTLGIYGFWYWVNLTKFFMENTTGQLPGGQKVSLSFRGTGGELFGKCFVALLLCGITLGIYTPWFICELYQYFYGKTRITAGDAKPLRLRFQGTGGDLFLTFLAGYFLSFITLGIYSFWFQVNIMRFLFGNTEVTTPTGNKLRVDFTGTGGEFALINIVGILLTVVTFGIYYFWFTVSLIKFQTDNIEIGTA